MCMPELEGWCSCIDLTSLHIVSPRSRLQLLLQLLPSEPPLCRCIVDHDDLWHVRTSCIVLHIIHQVMGRGCKLHLPTELLGELDDAFRRRPREGVTRLQDELVTFPCKAMRVN